MASAISSNLLSQRVGHSSRRLTVPCLSSPEKANVPVGEDESNAMLLFAERFVSGVVAR